jgi:hypothetical protein
VNSPELPGNDLAPGWPDLGRIISYLRASGWFMADEDARTSLWHLPNDDKSLVLPVRQDVTDYRDRIYEALRLLSYVERRAPVEITSDMIYGPADTVAIRLTPDAPSGQAPLSLAYEAISALRSYVIGSGAALDDHSLVLPARRSRQAETYASDARVSTQPGSFVISLTLPLVRDVRTPDNRSEATSDGPETGSQEEVQGLLVDVPPQPFGRRVTNRMAQVARYAQSLAEEVNDGNQTLPSFGRPTADAPNATELEALSNLGGPDRNPYQVRFAQSPLAPERNNQVSLRITPGQQRVMADAAEYLRTKQPRPNITVEGLVVGLSRNSNYGPGEVIVRGIIDDSGKQRRFHAELTEPDYDEALRAHGAGLHVSIRGDLETRGNWKWLRHPRGFVVVQGFEDDDE